MVTCGSKNGNQKDMCLEEIGLRTQNMLSFLGFRIQHDSGDLYDDLMSTRIFNLILNEMLI